MDKTTRTSPYWRENRDLVTMTIVVNLTRIISVHGDEVHGLSRIPCRRKGVLGLWFQHRGRPGSEPPLEYRVDVP